MEIRQYAARHVTAAAALRCAGHYGARRQRQLCGDVPPVLEKEHSRTEIKPESGPGACICSRRGRLDICGVPLGASALARGFQIR